MNAGQFNRRMAMIQNERTRSRGYQRKAVASLLREARAIMIVVHGKVTGWRLPNGQIICKKQRFNSEPEALNKLAGITENPMTARIPHRAYLCPHCLGWHLTSQIKALSPEPG